MNDHIQLSLDFKEVKLKEKAPDTYIHNNTDYNHSCQIIKSNTSNKRRKYSIEEQKRIIRIFDAINNKTKAIKFLQDICGYNEIYAKKIKRWKTCAKRPIGRPISQEFESEVLDEYKRLFPPHIELSHDNLRVCGHRVLNKEYVNADSGEMEQKWLEDPRTRKLKFTYKWIKGILTRNKCPVLSASAAAIEGMT
jgi:hypothetical protein